VVTLESGASGAGLRVDGVGGAGLRVDDRVLVLGLGVRLVKARVVLLGRDGW
jgi:hypothetical protein